MVEIYTTTSCRSCIKAIKWLKNRHIPYIEQNIDDAILDDEIVSKILKNTETGFDSIIAKQSKYYKDLKIDIDDMKISEARKVIADNPGILKKPIIIDVERQNIQIGYNKDDIKIFALNADHEYKKCPLSIDQCRKQMRIKIFKDVNVAKEDLDDN